MSVIEFEGKKPKIHPSVFLAPSAWVIGEVTLEEGVNIWQGSVIRGDDAPVKIGKNSTVLENCVVEAPTGNPIEIGENTIISHKATVHGSKVGNNCIVGIGAIVLDRVVIGDGAMVGSGAVVSPRTEIPEKMLALGVPAKPIREIRESEAEFMKKEHQRTLEKSSIYKKMFESMS